MHGVKLSHPSGQSVSVQAYLVSRSSHTARHVWFFLQGFNCRSLSLALANQAAAAAPVFAALPKMVMANEVLIVGGVNPNWIIRSLQFVE